MNMPNAMETLGNNEYTVEALIVDQAGKIKLAK